MIIEVRTAVTVAILAVTGCSESNEEFCEEACEESY